MSATFGVLGFPLAQSLSPFLHTWAFKNAGRADSYTSWEIPPEALPAFMESFRKTPYGGASVTIPHKQAVIPYLDGLSPEARAIGAVNTLYWKNGCLFGHNTDMAGFLTPLLGREPFDHAVIIGAGGAARAVLAGLGRLGTQRVTIVARNLERGAVLADDFRSQFSDVVVTDWESRNTVVSTMQTTTLVINTTPIGMRGKSEGSSPLDARAFAKPTVSNRSLAYDLVYNPLQTAFLKDASAAGWECVDGLSMFLGQAAAQFRLWTGEEMDIAGARPLLAKRLAEKDG